MNQIKNSLKGGIFYVAITKYSSIIISIVIGAALARLLTPKEFGSVALITVFITFFNLLSDFGIGPAVIQNQDINDEDIVSIFSFSVFMGIFMSLFFFFLSPVIIYFYDEPNLNLPAKLLSLVILFNSLQIVPMALLQKKIEFKIIGKITLIIQVICGLLALLLAYSGAGLYTLIIQNIFSSMLIFIVIYRVNPLNFKFKFKIGSVKKIIKFSSFQFLFNFINYFSRNSDNLLIGKYLGSAELGFYDKSYRLMLLPVMNLTHVVTPALMPILSQHQNDKDLVFNVYLKVVKQLSLLGFPLSVFLFFSAKELILLMYGDQWLLSVPVFKILSLSIGLQVVLSSSGAIFQAINRTDLLFKVGVLGAVFMVGCILVGILFGRNVIYIGYGIVLAIIISFFVNYFFLIKIALEKSFFIFVKIFIYPIILSLILIILYVLLDKVFNFLDLYKFFLQITILLLLYVVNFSKKMFAEFVNFKK